MSDTADVVAVMSPTGPEADPHATSRATAATGIEGRTPWQLAWQRLRRDRVAMVSLVVIGLIVLMAVAAPELGKALERANLRDPEFPVYSNVTAEPVITGERTRALLLEQLTALLHGLGMGSPRLSASFDRLNLSRSGGLLGQLGRGDRSASRSGDGESRRRLRNSLG